MDTLVCAELVYVYSS